MKTIKITKEGELIRAKIEGKPGGVGIGRNRLEALGWLISNAPASLGFRIDDSGLCQNQNENADKD